MLHVLPICLLGVINIGYRTHPHVCHLQTRNLSFLLAQKVFSNKVWMVKKCMQQASLLAVSLDFSILPRGPRGLRSSGMLHSATRMLIINVHDVKSHTSPHVTVKTKGKWLIFVSFLCQKTTKATCESGSRSSKWPLPVLGHISETVDTPQCKLSVRSSVRGGDSIPMINNRQFPSPKRVELRTSLESINFTSRSFMVSG